MALVVKEIRGILLFSKPNKHTISSPYSPYFSLSYVIHINPSIQGISSEEDYLVGTRCGSEVYNSTRVNEYKRYRTEYNGLLNIIREKYNYFINLETDSEIKKYINMLYKEWFGNDLYLPF